jgi:hypothetical protein
MLFWFYVSRLAILIDAELNGVIEQTVVRDVKHVDSDEPQSDRR